jgi:hypothetical protein
MQTPLNLKTTITVFCFSCSYRRRSMSSTGMVSRATVLQQHLEIAVKELNIVMVHVLLEAKANVTVGNDGNELIRSALANVNYSRIREHPYNNIMLIADRPEDVWPHVAYNVVGALIAHGADCSTINNTTAQTTILHVLVCNGALNSDSFGRHDYDFVRFLVDHGAPINCRIPKRETPLAHAARHNHTWIPPLILAGADAELIDEPHNIDPRWMLLQPAIRTTGARPSVTAIRTQSWYDSLNVDSFVDCCDTVSDFVSVFFIFISLTT